MRTSRRTGPFINANAYCDNRIYFNYIVTSLFRYQWFDKYIQPNSEITDCLYELSRGIIDHVIGIYMFMQIDYLNAKKKPKINRNFIEKVANKHYPGIQKILKELDLSTSEKERMIIMKQANTELNSIFEDKQKEFTEVILEEKTVEKDVMLTRVINNIQKCHDDFTPTSIISAYNKVLNIKENRNKSELELTKLTVMILLGKYTNRTSSNRSKSKTLLSQQDMEKYIES